MRRYYLIYFTDDTPCEERFSHISSLAIPSRSLALITPVNELRVKCTLTLIEMLLSRGLKTVIQIPLLTLYILDLSVSGRLLPELAWL